MIFMFSVVFGLLAQFGLLLELQVGSAAFLQAAEVTAHKAQSSTFLYWYGIY